MATSTAPRLVFGAGNIGDSKIDPIVRFDTPEQVEVILAFFESKGQRHLDTAQVYSPHAHGTSEPRLATAKAAERFLVDTKVKSIEAGDHKRENVLRNIDVSLERLQTEQINTLYLHQPDRTVPFEETCGALNQAYSEGKFKQWGLSNYSAEEVEEIVAICDAHDWKRPSVYQGQYNLIVRGGEKRLFPILRKHDMAFYAYSPAAAGFFAGNHKQVQPGGRYDASTFLGNFYASRYLQDGVKSATEAALSKAETHNIGGHAAALRWCAYHSALKRELGDAIIIGASSVAQLESNIDMINQGPLPEEVVEALNVVYDQIELTDTEIAYHW